MLNSLPQVCKPWVAAALSTICCGLGQVYCGRMRRGLAMFALSLMFAPAVVLAMRGAAVPWLVLFLGSVPAVMVLYVWSIVDAHRIATQMAGQAGESRRGYRPVVLWLMAIASVPCTLGAVFALRANVVEAFYLPSSSMAPTLVQGDRFLSNKLDIGSRPLARGDVVIFRAPDKRDQRWIKRIVGLPGDTVELRQGALFINGSALERTPVDEQATAAHEGASAFYEHNGERRYQVLIGDKDENADFDVQTVPAGEYFVLGDNRGRSHDSRKFGTVPRTDMVGVATWLYCPAESWDRFGEVR
jgi:signal peptidase I